MTWRYEQSSGSFYHNDTLITVGYSGLGEHKNKPEDQYLKGLGPLPVGKYHIGPLYDSPNVGPNALPLEALPGTDTKGRGDFKIHGDSIRTPGSASHGCVILPVRYRLDIGHSEDRTLEVFCLKS